MSINTKLTSCWTFKRRLFKLRPMIVQLRLSCLQPSQRWANTCVRVFPSSKSRLCPYSRLSGLSDLNRNPSPKSVSVYSEPKLAGMRSVREALIFWVSKGGREWYGAEWGRPFGLLWKRSLWTLDLKRQKLISIGHIPDIVCRTSILN